MVTTKTMAIDIHKNKKKIISLQKNPQLFIIENRNVGNGGPKKSVGHIENK